MTDSLDDVISKLEAHMEEYKVRSKIWDEQHEKTMLAIADLTGSTQGLVDAWTTGNNLYRFLKWLSGLAIIGGILTWFSNHITF